MAKQSQCNRLVLQEIGSISGGENDELIRVAEAWPFNSRGRDGVVTNPLCGENTHTGCRTRRWTVLRRWRPWRTRYVGGP